MSAIRKPIPGNPQRQRGAVLYVALIMLILLALIGVIGAQVSSMQERMSSNYFAANRAFQSAERVARTNEKCIEGAVNRTASCATPVDQYCDSPDAPDAVTWAGERELSDGFEVRLRSVGHCTGETSIVMGKKPVSEDSTPVYQVSAFSTDTAFSEDGDKTPASSAAIDTIFRP